MRGKYILLSFTTRAGHTAPHARGQRGGGGGGQTTITVNV